MITKFKNMDLLAAAIVAGQVPHGCVSPGGAAALLGITRQAVNSRIHNSGSLDAYIVPGGAILVSLPSIKKALKEKRGISDKQGELAGLEAQ